MALPIMIAIREVEPWKMTKIRGDITYPLDEMSNRVHRVTIVTCESVNRLLVKSSFIGQAEMASRLSFPSAFPETFFIALIVPD